MYYAILSTIEVVIPSSTELVMTKLVILSSTEFRFRDEINKKHENVRKFFQGRTRRTLKPKKPRILLNISKSKKT